VLSAAGRHYKATVSLCAIQAGMRPLSGAVVLSVDVFRPRRAGDLDNTIKSLQDGLKGVAWHDDSQVVEIHARRFDDKMNPRAEVTVTEV
jgi:crossover junction endodeoxyribonuclease RusA